MKLQEKNSNLNFFNKLNDKSINLPERLKLAKSSWDSKDYAKINKNQLIIEWACDLIINKKANSLNETDQITVWDRLNYFLEDSSSESNPINNGLGFSQCLIDSLNSSNEALKECVQICCARLFNTKFSHYLTRNFDQMVKIMNLYVNDLLDRIKNGENNLDSQFERTNLVLNKFLFCLKTQQNINRLFNRMCTHVLFKLLNLMNQIDKLDGQRHASLKDLCLKIIKFGLLSKSHSNIYIEFFKNLPSSFSSKSNYQVIVLFHTIQTESIKNSENMESVANYVNLISKEIYSILLNIDYKLKISIIQFMTNLVWNLDEITEDTESEKMEVDNEFTKSRDFTDLKINAVANLIKLIDEINLFNPLDDQNNENVFQNWSKQLIAKVLDHKFNLTKFLTEYLTIDHLILENDLDLILAYLKAENKMTDFLNFYIDSNIKYRQLSRATFRLIDAIKANESLTFPVGFYQHYGECLENYLVDNQTIVSIWKDLMKALPLSHKNLKVDLLKFLNCILCRINLCSPSVPPHLKTNAIQLLNETKEFLNTFLLNLQETSQNEETLSYLECYKSCGLLYVLLYRFSIRTIGSGTPTVQFCASSLENLNDFFVDLNDKFKLDDKIKHEVKKFGSKKQNLNLLLQLNKLELLNVYRLNMLEATDSDLKKLKKSLFNPSFELKFSKIDDKKWSLVNNFNIETKLKDETLYSLVHFKSIIFDNIYLILPLFREQTEVLEYLFEMVLKLVYNIDNLNHKLITNEVNLNALFNDESLMKPLFNSLLNVLGQLEATQDEMITDEAKKNLKFIEKLKKLIQNDFDEKTKSELFESKKLSKYELNSNQVSLVFKIGNYLPLEFLNANYAIIYYLITEKIRIKDSETEKKCINIYNQLLLTNLIQTIPIQKLESWLNEFFSLFENFNLSETSKQVFDKLIKKSIGYMLKEQNIDIFAHFVDSLFQKLKSKPDIKSDIIKSTFLQTLEKNCRLQELSDTKEESYDKKLSDLSEKLFDCFIKNDSTSQNESFYITSILIKHVVSSKFRKDKKKDKKLEYFKSMLESCLQQHKVYIKGIKKSNEKIQISSFYVEFLNTLIVNSKKLVSYHQVDVDRVKLLKQLFNLYMGYEANKVDLHVGNEDNIENYLIKLFVQSMNSLDTNDFKQILEFFELEIQENFNSSNNVLLKISEILKYASNELELNDELKPDFSEFLQKFLIQTPPIYLLLKTNNQKSYLLSLLESQSGIIGSKYFLLPSHLVISIIQIYVSLSYDKLDLQEYVKFQELACKTVNVILTRYSKKFSKLADVICNLFMKLIYTTTNFANQNILKDVDVKLAIKAAQDLERIITQLLAFKKEFSKIAPYMISEYVYKANTIPIHLSVKNILTNAVFNLISICDMHAIAQLHVVLANGPKDLFKNIYHEYEKYFKYTGKV